MDTGNDNIFEAGIDKPAGGPVGNSDGVSVTGASPAGRIDPAIAIAANGSGDNGGSGTGNPGGGTGRAPGLRGRHPAACGCEKCVAKRQAQGGVAPAPAAAPKAEKTRAVKAGLIEKLLFGIHLGIASATKCPEFNLQKDDAEKLGDSIAAVMAYHKVKITPEQEAYGDLFIVASQVYPPMLMSVYFRKKFEAEQRAKNAPPKAPVMQPQRANVPPVKPPADNVQPLRPAAQTFTGGFDPFKIEMPQG